ncbi:hypothetical protein AB0H03_12655 [Streptomyces sparsogenes]|uniref:hypothetical protein n=1 Tax=Streptomyces sparsogenes TaxID=67365 RepID=UPI0033FD20BE
MTLVLGPGPPADGADAARAQERHRELRAELPRVREAALSWRNGLAGLLLALIGFGLIRGRSEIDKVAAPWHIVIGCLLLAALLVGALGAYWLLRAHNGKPALTPVDFSTSTVTQDHLTARAALGDLRRGIAATLLCTALLVAAVGTTWYGPEKSGPKLRLRTPGTTLCGSAATAADGRLSLSTKSGRVTVDPADVLTVEPVEQCP